MTEFLIIIGLILFNGILSMSEMSVVSSRKSRLELEAKKGSATARKALELSNNPDNFFSTIQIGITLIFGELVPKRVGLVKAEEIAKVMVLPHK